MTCRHGLQTPGTSTLYHSETSRPIGCVALIEYFDHHSGDQMLVADWISVEGYQHGWYRASSLRGRMGMPEAQQGAFLIAKVLKHAREQNGVKLS